MDHTLAAQGFDPRKVQLAFLSPLGSKVWKVEKKAERSVKEFIYLRMLD